MVDFNRHLKRATMSKLNKKSDVRKLSNTSLKSNYSSYKDKKLQKSTHSSSSAALVNKLKTTVFTPSMNKCRNRIGTV